MASFWVLAALLLLRAPRLAWQAAAGAIPLGVALGLVPALIYAWPLLQDALTWPLSSQLLLLTGFVTSIRAYAYGLPLDEPRTTAGDAEQDAVAGGADPSALADAASPEHERPGLSDDHMTAVILLCLPAWFVCVVIGTNL